MASIRDILQREKSSRINDAVSRKSDSPNRNCTACKKKPVQVQCLHCSEHVCLECAQKHVNLVAQESDGAMHLLNEKLDILDRIATNTRQQIVAERDKIVKQADVERDRSFALLAQMVEEEKQQIRNKNKELNELPLNEVPIFIRQLKSDVQHLIDKNDSFFVVNSSMPQITLKRQNERHNMDIRNVRRGKESKYDDEMIKTFIDQQELKRLSNPANIKVQKTVVSRSKISDDDDI